MKRRHGLKLGLVLDFDEGTFFTLIFLIWFSGFLVGYFVYHYKELRRIASGGEGGGDKPKRGG